MSVYLEGANWRDRILNHYPPASDGERYYKIVEPDGTVVAEAAKLELLNTVLPGNEGTPVNAGNMNSILAAMGMPKKNYSADKLSEPYLDTLFSYIDFTGELTPTVGEFTLDNVNTTQVAGPHSNYGQQGTTNTSGLTASISLVPTGARTVSFWLKWQSGAQVLVDETGDNARNFGTTIKITEAGVVQVYIMAGQENPLLTLASTTKLTAGEWTKIDFAWDGTPIAAAARLYFNGERVGTGMASGGYSNTAATFGTALLNRAPVSASNFGGTAAIAEFTTYTEARYDDAMTLEQKGFSLFDGALIRIKPAYIMQGAGDVLLNINEQGNVPISVAVTKDTWTTLVYDATKKVFCAPATVSTDIPITKFASAINTSVEGDGSVQEKELISVFPDHAHGDTQNKSSVTTFSSNEIYYNESYWENYAAGFMDKETGLNVTVTVQQGNSSSPFDNEAVACIAVARINDDGTLSVVNSMTNLFDISGYNRMDGTAGRPAGKLFKLTDASDGAARYVYMCTFYYVRDNNYTGYRCFLRFKVARDTLVATKEASTTESAMTSTSDLCAYLPYLTTAYRLDDTTNDVIIYYAASNSPTSGTPYRYDLSTFSKKEQAYGGAYTNNILIPICKLFDFSTDAAAFLALRGNSVWLYTVSKVDGRYYVNEAISFNTGAFFLSYTEKKYTLWQGNTICRYELRETTTNISGKQVPTLSAALISNLVSSKYPASYSSQTSPVVFQFSDTSLACMGTFNATGFSGKIIPINLDEVIYGAPSVPGTLSNAANFPKYTVIYKDRMLSCTGMPQSSGLRVDISANVLSLQNAFALSAAEKGGFVSAIVSGRTAADSVPLTKSSNVIKVKEDAEDKGFVVVISPDV